jgi:hypothetical protein
MLWSFNYVSNCLLIVGLFNDAFNSSEYTCTPSNERITREFEMMWKESVVASFEVLEGMRQESLRKFTTIYEGRRDLKLELPKYEAAISTRSRHFLPTTLPRILVYKQNTA